MIYFCDFRFFFYFCSGVQIFIGKSNKYHTQRWSSKKSNNIGVAGQSIGWYKIWCVSKHAKTEETVSLFLLLLMQSIPYLWIKIKSSHFNFANAEKIVAAKFNQIKTVRPNESGLVWSFHFAYVINLCELLCLFLFLTLSLSLSILFKGFIGCQKFKWAAIVWRVLITGNSTNGSSQCFPHTKYSVP